MKKILYTFMMLVAALSASAQNNKSNNDEDRIVISTYLEQSTDSRGDKLLGDKLNRIVTNYGLGGFSLDHRFIITANAIELESVTTATIPARTVTTYSLTIYIGDAIENTVYATYNVELQGVGKTKKDAYHSAIRKLDVDEVDIEYAIDKAKKRIVEFYNQNADDVIRRAKTFASHGNYTEAVKMLYTIPTLCSQYQLAQELICEYAETQINNTNLEILRRAEAAWSVSPDADGALQAQQILAELYLPSNEIISRVENLNGDISSRLKEVEDREWQQEQKAVDEMIAYTKKAQENEYELEKLRIDAVVKIGTAPYTNAPAQPATQPTAQPEKPTTNDQPAAPADQAQPASTGDPKNINISWW